jgi:hypothetical protein
MLAYYVSKIVVMCIQREDFEVFDRFETYVMFMRFALMQI